MLHNEFKNVRILNKQVKLDNLSRKTIIIGRSSTPPSTIADPHCHLQQSPIFNADSGFSFGGGRSLLHATTLGQPLNPLKVSICFPTRSDFIMNSSYPAELYKHLEKQNQLLMEAKRTISHELHKLKVEEEMMMRKFYELMAARKQAKKSKKEENVSDEGGEDASNKVEKGESSALVCHPSDER